jgi:hypothetical protein
MWSEALAKLRDHNRLTTQAFHSVKVIGAYKSWIGVAVPNTKPQDLS